MLATTIQITNNPPHTPTPKPLKAQAGYAGNHHNNGGRQHGVEREPDSVLIRFKLLCPTQTRTHTHHPLLGSEHMQAQENKPRPPPNGQTP